MNKTYYFTKDFIFVDEIENIREVRGQQEVTSKLNGIPIKDIKGITSSPPGCMIWKNDHYGIWGNYTVFEFYELLKEHEEKYK